MCQDLLCRRTEWYSMACAILHWHTHLVTQHISSPVFLAQCMGFVLWSLACKPSVARILVTCNADGVAAR